MTALSAAQCSLLSLHQSHINHKEKTPLMETLGKMSHMNYSSWQDASIFNLELTCHQLKKSTYVCGLWVTNVIWYAVNSPNFVQTVQNPLWRTWHWISKLWFSIQVYKQIFFTASLNVGWEDFWFWSLRLLPLTKPPAPWQNQNKTYTIEIL